MCPRRVAPRSAQPEDQDHALSGVVGAPRAARRVWIADGAEPGIRSISLIPARREVGGGARLCHFSVQKNHIHLIVEPPAGARGTGVEKALANAMRGLAIRIARTLNGALNRRGSAFAHRYHSRELASPLEVKRALNYVIDNGRKHHLQAGDGKPPGWSDPCCSAAFVPAWSRRSRHLPPARAPAADDPVAAPRTWLLRTGWHEKHGGLDAFASLKVF